MKPRNPIALIAMQAKPTPLERQNRKGYNLTMLETGAAIFVTGIGASIVAEFFPPERQWVVILLAFILLAAVM